MILETPMTTEIPRTDSSTPWPSPQEAQALRASFLRIIPNSEEASLRLYDRLFEIDPALRSLFGEDMIGQQEKLVKMLAAAIDMLDDPEGFEASCRQLGKRHQAYGALPHHYPIVGRLLLEEFGRAAEPPFSKEETALWAKLYDQVATAMLSVEAA